MPIPALIWKPRSISVEPRRLRLLLALLVGLCICILATRASASDSIAGKVLRVFDGDTIEVLLNSGKIRVRLHGIDAPERDQPQSAAARAWLAQQVQNQSVRLEPITQDRYDRMVARVFLGERNINSELVAQGHAWAYRHYLHRSDRKLCELEAAARAARRGVWVDAEPQAPWEFRASKGRGPYTHYAATSAKDCRRAIGP
jgi:micrococcal nuclease